MIKHQNVYHASSPTCCLRYRSQVSKHMTAINQRSENRQAGKFQNFRDPLRSHDYRTHWQGEVMIF
jgi:hypothetical protein